MEHIITNTKQLAQSSQTTLDMFSKPTKGIELNTFGICKSSSHFCPPICTHNIFCSLL